MGRTLFSATPARAPRTDGSQDVRTRMALYGRYAALVARQAQALQDDDLEAFRSLTDERGALQQALGPVPPDMERGRWSLDPELRLLVTRTRTALEEAALADEDIRRRLSTMRQETARDIRAIEARESGARRYVSEDGAGSPRRAKLDIRL